MLGSYHVQYPIAHILKFAGLADIWYIFCQVGAYVPSLKNARRIFRPGVFLCPNGATATNDVAKALKRDRFLDCLQRLGSARAACRAAKLPRSTPYKWREALPDFAEEWREAMAAAGGPRSSGMGDAIGTRISEIR